jgi:phosphoketolase
VRAAGGSWHSSKFLNPARDGAVLPVAGDEPAAVHQDLAGVLRTPKGWTGPKVVDGVAAHRVPLDAARTNLAHLAQLSASTRNG